MGPKLSIVIPVYNVENYLENCINSILNQSFKDFELILVNDGSTDNSLCICNKFKKLDERIKLFDKSNGGVSSARNVGLEHATGEWIYFVDADDTVCEELLSIFEVEQICDIIQFGYRKINLDGSVLSNGPTINASYISADEYTYFSKFKTLSLWIHFFKTDLIKNNNILFSEGIRYAEDLEFVIKCFGCASLIKTNSVVGYNYYVRYNSTMTKAYTFENARIHLDVAKNLIEFFTSNNIAKNIFYRSKIEYMLKSYFSFNIRVKDLKIKRLVEDYHFFAKNLKIQNIVSGLLRISIFSPRIYFYLMKIKAKR